MPTAKMHVECCWVHIGCMSSACRLPLACTSSAIRWPSCAVVFFCVLLDACWVLLDVCWWCGGCVLGACQPRISCMLGTYRVHVGGVSGARRVCVGYIGCVLYTGDRYRLRFS